MSRYVVTGGSGFLGRHLVDALLAKYQAPSKVIVFDLRKYEHDDESTKDRIESYAGSVTQLGDLIKAFNKATIVFHCVSANPLDNTNKQLMWNVNVEGTKQVIEACKQCNVSKLIYISSASVVFDGKRLPPNANESQPYPKIYIDYYSETKALAEKLVLKENKDTLLTCSIRPSSIFGERDPLYLPRLIEAGKQNKSKYIIGNGKTKWEFTYVGNVTEACIKACEHLKINSKVGGQAYFVTNDENTLFWNHMGIMLSGLGYDPPSVHIPFILCYILAFLIDLILFIISPVYKPKNPPNLSKQRVLLLSTDRSISCDKAKRDFGYKACVSMEEANRRTIEYFKRQAAWTQSKKEE